MHSILFYVVFDEFFWVTKVSSWSSCADIDRYTSGPGGPCLTSLEWQHQFRLLTHGVPGEQAEGFRTTSLKSPKQVEGRGRKLCYVILIRLLTTFIESPLCARHLRHPEADPETKPGRQVVECVMALGNTHREVRWARAGNQEKVMVSSWSLVTPGSSGVGGPRDPAYLGSRGLSPANPDAPVAQLGSQRSVYPCSFLNWG